MISLSSVEVERRFAILGIPNCFSPDEHRALSTTSVDETMESAIRFPIPRNNVGLNIMNLKEHLSKKSPGDPFFFDHPWFLGETFAREDCSAGWHFLTTAVLRESVSQPINYARSLESRGFELPSAIEIALMVFLHYVGTGEHLLHKKHTWCREKATLDRFVTVGAFGRNGLFVSAHPADYSSRGLGICPCIRR